MWSRKGIPVLLSATPVPSKFIFTDTFVSFVTLFTSPIRATEREKTITKYEFLNLSLKIKTNTKKKYIYIYIYNLIRFFFPYQRQLEKRLRLWSWWSRCLQLKQHMKWVLKCSFSVAGSDELVRLNLEWEREVWEKP